MAVDLKQIADNLIKKKVTKVEIPPGFAVALKKMALSTGPSQKLYCTLTILMLE